MIATAAMVYYWRHEAGPAPTALSPLSETWVYCGPVVIVYLLLMPLVAVDMIRFSNRIVGPMLRLRRSMRQLARGQHVKPLAFRDNDMWRELANEFNAVASHAQGHAVTPQQGAGKSRAGRSGNRGVVTP